MSLYLENGFFDFSEAVKHSTTFNFVIGGRGTGKTYGSLKWCLEHKKKFIFMRRLQKEVDIISKDELSPFKVYGDMFGGAVLCRPVSKYVTGVYISGKDEEGNNVISGPPVGYVCALSSIANLRGFNTSDIEIILFDEFIPEKSSARQKYLGDALLNAYETINRNRELFGSPPAKLFAMANSNDLGNDIFISLGLVNLIEKMSRKRQEFYQDQERGVTVIMLNNSKISEKKRKTALYQLTRGSEFSKMSLDNDFSYDDRFNIKSRPIREYKPLFSWGGIYVYEHKSRPEYYVSFHGSGTPEVFSGEVGRHECRRMFAGIWKHYYNGSVYFENYDALRIFRKLYK